MHDQQDKKRAYENYRHTAELSTGGGLDSFEPKTMVTRKLRRRHYEPLPMPEKRRKLAPLSSLVYVLDEHEVDDDLKVIFKGKITANPKLLTSPVPVAKNDGGAVYEARIEDGKLYYENRAFHKGQHIFIDSKEHGQESGIISSVGQSEVCFQNPCCVYRYCMSPYSYSRTEYFSRSHVFSSPLDMGKEVARQLEAEDLRDSVSQRKIRPQAKECLTFCSFMFCVLCVNSSVYSLPSSITKYGI
ncbi:Sin3 histone deacetylase corepressor complex component SDS3 [Geodia barretti]|uniref:Sin3 histone deacetylase corepressor complex component SDS3 n=1 Tax=Geodia barretti TaxID=519541 RepID=A0AA35QV75_GEOBA|nr:Sin3 histone deacetylase corepressor complex component SDS3 [Geodia barretti]